MNRRLTIEYEDFEEDGIKVLSVVDSEKDEVINMVRGNDAEKMYSLLTDIPKEKKIPYYDFVNKTWKVMSECGIEEGDALYIASEFVKGGLIYPFHSEAPEKGKHRNHAHDFTSVVEFLLNRPPYFSIEGFEEHYSTQEQELLVQLQKKLEKCNS